MSKQVDNVRALTIEGLTMTVAGTVRDELRLCCAVPRAFSWGIVSFVLMIGVEIRRVGLVCRGYELGAGWRSSRWQSTMQCR